jgi:hypothetical protein
MAPRIERLTVRNLRSGRCGSATRAQPDGFVDAAVDRLIVEVETRYPELR